MYRLLLLVQDFNFLKIPLYHYRILLGSRWMQNFEICKKGYRCFVSRFQGIRFRQYQGFHRDLIWDQLDNLLYHSFSPWDHHSQNFGLQFFDGDAGKTAYMASTT